ncbi:hypothetical protein DLK05_10275 [Ancylomarina longa]|uniref:Uncharacterized protein n=1 Tax=Ancylomarina longa TaxID=2487017 RepID=A0A434AUA5_9BACT|nr:hypothetical protein DLK05_10275 [Ancylomarina longa]
MKISEIKTVQNLKLKEMCSEKKIDYNSMLSLLDSVKTKKLLKRNNYHQQKLNDEIEKALK